MVGTLQVSDAHLSWQHCYGLKGSLGYCIEVGVVWGQRWFSENLMERILLYILHLWIKIAIHESSTFSVHDLRFENGL